MEADTTNGAFIGVPEGERGNTENPQLLCPSTESKGNVKDAGVDSLDDPEAEQSRQSSSTCCSSPAANIFDNGSPQRPQQMQPKNIVPPLSPNPGEDIGNTGNPTSSSGNTPYSMSQPHSIPPQAQFPQYGVHSQMQPQMLQMLQIQQGGQMMVPSQLTPNGTPVDVYGDDRFLKRRKRCGECGPCKVTKNCDQCKNCLNRKVLKQTCIYRKCIFLRKKEQGGESEILDYPSPVPPAADGQSGFLSRTGGQVSPTVANNQPQQSAGPPQQQAQIPPPAPQNQPPPMQMPSISNSNGGPNNPGFVPGQGFPLQYGGVMNNSGFMPGGPLVPNTNQQHTQQSQQPQQLPPPATFVQPNAPSLQSQQARFMQPQAANTPAQMSGQVSTASKSQPPQMQPQQQIQSHFQNSRQTVQPSVSDGGEQAKALRGKQYGNPQSQSGDSMSSFTQQQSINVPPNGFGQVPLGRLGTMVSNGNDPSILNGQQPFSSQQQPHQSTMGHANNSYAYMNQIHGQYDYNSYPIGSDNPFCHLKMCGGSGHDQKFLSLISYNDSFMDPQQSYSHYYHQIPQNNFGNSSSANSASSTPNLSSLQQMPTPQSHVMQHHQQQNQGVLHPTGHHHNPLSESSFYGGTSYPSGSAPVNGMLQHAPMHPSHLSHLAHHPPASGGTAANEGYHHTANSVA